MSERATSFYETYLRYAALAQQLDGSLSDDTKGWACVVRFYATLHLVNAYLLLKHQLHFDPSSTVHFERAKALKKCLELRDAPEKYRHLKDLSESVRYDVGFDYGTTHDANARNLFRKIVDITEPKVKRSLGIA